MGDDDIQAKGISRKGSQLFSQPEDYVSYYKFSVYKEKITFIVLWRGFKTSLVWPHVM